MLTTPMSTRYVVINEDLKNLLTIVNHNPSFTFEKSFFSKTHCSVHLLYSQFMTITKYIQTVHEIHGQDNNEHRNIQRYVAR